MVNTLVPPGAQERFTIVRGPAILPNGFVQVGNSPWAPTNDQNLRNFAMATSIDQLARRGIVIRS